jgi:hypothetical protein
MLNKSVKPNTVKPSFEMAEENVLDKLQILDLFIDAYDEAAPSNVGT